MRAFVMTVAATLWAAALVPAAFLVPVYSGTSSSGGAVRETSSTLVDVNGTGVALVVAAPLIVCLLVWALLHHTCSRGANWSHRAAWVLVGLVGLFVFVGAASIGLFLVPVLVLLVAAAANTARPAAVA